MDYREFVREHMILDGDPNLIIENIREAIWIEATDWEEWANGRWYKREYRQAGQQATGGEGE